MKKFFIQKLKMSSLSFESPPRQVTPVIAQEIREALSASNLPCKVRYYLQPPSFYYTSEQIENLPGPTGWIGPGTDLNQAIDSKFYEVRMNFAIQIPSEHLPEVKDKLAQFQEKCPCTPSGRNTLFFSLPPIYERTIVNYYFSSEFRQAASLLNCEPKSLQKSFKDFEEPSNIYSQEPDAEGQEPVCSKREKTGNILGYNLVLKIIEPVLHEHWSDFSKLLDFLKNNAGALNQE